MWSVSFEYNEQSPIGEYIHTFQVDPYSNLVDSYEQGSLACPSDAQFSLDWGYKEDNLIVEHLLHPKNHEQLW